VAGNTAAVDPTRATASASDEKDGAATTSYIGIIGHRSYMPELLLHARGVPFAPFAPHAEGKKPESGK
jgi:hypothetical protein